MEQVRYIGHIRGLGGIYEMYAPFNKQIQIFNAVGIKAPISIRDCAYMRLKTPYDGSSLTCHAPICAKDSPTIIAKMSPLIANLEMAEKLVESHRKRRYLFFDEDKSIYAEWEKIAKQDNDKKPEEKRAIILDTRENFEIHRESDLARFFLEDTREDYFEKYFKEDKDKIPCSQIPIKEIDCAKGTMINTININHPKGHYDPEDGFFFGTYSKISMEEIWCHERTRSYGILREKNPPEFSEIDEINSGIISNALREKKEFQFNGVLYVPVILNK